MMTERYLPADDVAIEREAAEKLYRGGYLMVHPDRWIRIRDGIAFEDVVRLFIPGHHQVMSCPFHGRDSKPSFHLYHRTNDAWCFGCPPGEQYYDHVRFVAAMRGITRLQALTWLEREFRLPKLADIDQDEYLEDHAEEFVSVTFRDLKDPFVRHALRDIREQGNDLELAKEYLEILFDAWPTRAEEQQNPDAGDALALARILGAEIVDAVLTRKTTHPKERKY